MTIKGRKIETNSAKPVSPLGIAGVALSDNNVPKSDSLASGFKNVHPYNNIPRYRQPQYPMCTFPIIKEIFYFTNDSNWYSSTVEYLQVNYQKYRQCEMPPSSY